MMRQKTARIDLGTSLCGFSDSPAAMPTSSVPWNEKPAIMNTATTPRNPLWKGPSSRVQFVSPGEADPITPKIMATPAIRKTTTVTTLIVANQNSASPYTRAESALSMTRNARKLPAHTHEGTVGNQ